jgi:hypothetical protein
MSTPNVLSKASSYPFSESSKFSNYFLALVFFVALFILTPVKIGLNLATLIILAIAVGLTFWLNIVGKSASANHCKKVIQRNINFYFWETWGDSTVHNHEARAAFTQAINHMIKLNPKGKYEIQCRECFQYFRDMDKQAAYLRPQH